MKVGEHESTQRVSATISYTALRNMRAISTGALHEINVRDVVESLFYSFIYFTSGNRVLWKHCGDALRIMEALKFVYVFGRFRVLLEQVKEPYRGIVVEFRDLIFESSKDGTCIRCKDASFADVLNVLGKSLSLFQSSDENASFKDEDINNIPELVTVFDIDISNLPGRNYSLLALMDLDT